MGSVVVRRVLRFGVLGACVLILGRGAVAMAMPGTILERPGAIVDVTAQALSEDAYEPDDSAASARSIPVNGEVRQHTIDILDDEDWVSFPVTAGTTYLVRTSAGTPEDETQTQVALFRSDRTTLIKWGTNDGETLYSRLRWTADANGTVYARVTSSGDIVGAERGTYALSVSTWSLTEVAIAGEDRVQTAVEVSKRAFAAGSSDWVIVTTGYNWPDALGGSALAGVLGCPILLTSPTNLSPDVVREIQRIGASRAIVLGGTPAVSASVYAAVDAIPGVAVERIQGADRYETARKIAERTVFELRKSGVYDGKVFVATGRNFPDALGASPLAAAKGWPIYLVDPGAGLDPAVVASMRSIGVTQVIILGSPAAIPGSIGMSLQSASLAVSRLYGPDRYGTAVAVARHGVDVAGLHWDQLAVATGLNFPDALAGGVLQARSGSVMLLTPPTTTITYDRWLRQCLAAYGFQVHEVRYLGGTSAVATAVRSEIRGLLLQ